MIGRWRIGIQNMKEHVVPRILLIDDDEFFSRSLQDDLEDAGFELVSSRDASDGLSIFEEDEIGFDVVIADMAMPGGPRFSDAEVRSGFQAGLALSRKILRRKHDASIIGITAFPSEQLHTWFGKHHFPLLQKGPRMVRDLLDCLERLRPESERKQRKCFIVHGRDVSAIEELCGFVNQNVPGYLPVILSESKSEGRTVIEKFEAYADAAFIALVLMTPDDRVLGEDGARIAHRARQNVIFELGYFLGRLGRSSGRVLILTKGDVEIPSDIAGVMRIDISAGISQAGPELLRELTD